MKTKATHSQLPTTAQTACGIAVCNAITAVNESGVSPEVLLIPDGEFSSHDGRPFDVPNNKWLLDQQAASLITSAALNRKNDFLFDYDHQTLRSVENGKPAPAAGWFGELQYVAGKGLVALNVKWTPKAAQMLKDKEMRYVSPVFHYDKATGRPTKLLHVALTNDPAVLGMDEVAILNSLTPNQTNQPNSTNGVTMNHSQLLAALVAAIGITVDGDVTEAQVEQAKDKLKDLQGKSDEVVALTSQVAALNTQIGSNADVDLTKYVPVETYNGLVTQLAALNTQHSAATIDAAIDAAKADGRIVEAETTYLKQLGEQQGVAALNALLDARTPLVALNANQVTTNTPQDQAKTGVAALTADDKYAADALGISYDEFAKNKEQK